MRAFLEWLAADHFTFLGYRAHDLVMKDGDDALAVVPGSGLGILREKPGEALATSFSQLPPQVRAYARVKDLLIITKANCAFDRAPAGLPRLHRHQALRRPRRGGGRAPLPRALHPHRVPHAPERDPAPAAQGRQRAGEGGARARRALVEIAREHPRHVSARRALPDARGRARRDGDRHPAPRRPPALPPLRPPRPVRAVRRLPHLRAARELQHRSAQEVAVDPDEGVQRPVVGVRHLPVAVGARAHHDHGAHDPRADPAGRRARARGAARRRGAPLGGRPARGAPRRGGRGARQRALPPLRRGLPRRLPRGRPGAERGARLRDAREGRRRRRARAQPLPAARSAAGHAAVQALPQGRTGHALRQPADARAHGPARARGAAVPDRARVGRSDLDARLRARHRRRRGRDRRRRRDLRGGVRPRLLGRGRERRLQPPGARRAPHRRRDRGAARLREVPAADRLPALAGFHRADAGREPGDRAHARQSLPVALRSREGRRGGRRPPGERDRAGARQGGQPERGPGAAAVPRAPPRDEPHQLLAPRRGRPAADVPLVQVRPVEGARAPRPEADVRDLRVLGAVRGRAPARRQGRARRPALVRPAGGLPHRGARPGQGADGEERRHRAGRVEGRVRAEARARRVRSRGAS